MTATEHGSDARWVVHSERPVYESPWVKVNKADISRPSGDRFEHHTVWFPPAAMIVVFDEQRAHVLLSWRHRFAPDIWNYELPGGIVEPSEDPAATAAREVEEETGFRVRDVRPIVTFEPAVGMLRNPNYVFEGIAAGRIAEPTEENEGVFEWVPFADVPELIRQGKIVNSGTLIALLHILALGGNVKPAAN